jgi:protein-tyrosine phosphatase
MPFFFDLHTHMLCGVDDGAKTEEEMYAMLEMAYADGTRALCVTPHYSPYLFGDTYEASEASFALLADYVAKRHPDMYLYLGHELGYHGSCINALNDGYCRSIAGSRYVLVDFPENVGFFEIQKAMNQLQQTGYHPILAHTERYRALHGKIKWIEDFVESGGKVQINASSILGDSGSGAKSQWKKLLSKRLAHIISSDGHNLTTRLPKMSVCMDYLKKNCDAQYIRELTWDNACHVIMDELF